MREGKYHLPEARYIPYKYSAHLQQEVTYLSHRSKTKKQTYLYQSCIANSVVSLIFGFQEYP